MKANRRLFIIFFCCLFSLLGLLRFFSFAFSFNKNPGPRYQEVALYREALPADTLIPAAALAVKPGPGRVSREPALREYAAGRTVSRAYAERRYRTAGNVETVAFAKPLLDTSHGFSLPFKFADIREILSKDAFASTIVPAVPPPAVSRTAKPAGSYALLPRLETVEAKNIEDTAKPQPVMQYALNTASVVSPDTLNAGFIPKLGRDLLGLVQNCKVSTSSDNKPVIAVTVLQF